MSKIVFTKNNEPAYLKDILIKPGNDRTSRSTNDKTLLLIIRNNLITYDDRAFDHFGAFTWNSLPMSIRVLENTSAFKRELKAYIFEYLGSVVRGLRRPQILSMQTPLSTAVSIAERRC